MCVECDGVKLLRVYQINYPLPKYIYIKPVKLLHMGNNF